MLPLVTFEGQCTPVAQVRIPLRILGTLTGGENVSALALKLLQQMTYRGVSTQTMAQSVSLAV